MRLLLPPGKKTCVWVFAEADVLPCQSHHLRGAVGQPVTSHWQAGEREALNTFKILELNLMPQQSNGFLNTSQSFLNIFIF